MEEKSRIQKENCFAVSVGQEWGTETVIPVIQQRPLFFPSWIILALTIVIAALTGVPFVTSIKEGNLSWPW